ncbi:MAG: hypothetical protein NC924_06150, partial [Candidatus Omnitrophica bacterium]|nr:hypothetical protein [Candidatus Omnitrophota bacterium]
MNEPMQRGDIWVMPDRIYIETGEKDFNHHRTFISIFFHEVSEIPTLVHVTAQIGLSVWQEATRYRRIDSPAAVISLDQVRMQYNGV